MLCILARYAPPCKLKAACRVKFRLKKRLRTASGLKFGAEFGHEPFHAAREQGYHGIKAGRAAVVGVRHGALRFLRGEPLPHAAHAGAILLMACEGEDVLLVVLILRDDEVKLAEISTAEGAGAVAAIAVPCALI